MIQDAAPARRAARLLSRLLTTTALRPTRRRDLFAVTAATYWKWGFAATGALHADAPRRRSTPTSRSRRKSDDRPMLTVTPLVHRGKLPRPKALGGRGSTYDMEPGIIGSIVLDAEALLNHHKTSYFAWSVTVAASPPLTVVWHASRASAPSLATWRSSHS